MLGRIRAALMEINFIGNCIRSRESSDAAADEWQYVAMVVDRVVWFRVQEYPFKTRPRVI